MIDSMLDKLSNLLKCLNPIQQEEARLDTLTALVRDAEQEILSVVTALQAHIDLLHDEHERDHLPVDRFVVLNRSMERLIADTTSLATVSELVQARRSTKKQSLERLMQEITQETLPAFEHSGVSLACQIAKGTILIGDADSLKILITEIILALLEKCHQLDIMNVSGLTERKRVSMSFDIGTTNSRSEFKPWRLGTLRLLPTTGEGIGLSAIEAMARIHHGHLSVSAGLDRRSGYKLIFQV